MSLSLADVAKVAFGTAAWVCAIYGDWNGFGIVLCMGFALGCMLQDPVEHEERDV
jgi:hypothetical protein